MLTAEMLGLQVLPKLHSMAHYRTRRAERVPLLSSAILRLGADREFDARLLNLSTVGFAVEAPTPLPIGGEIQLVIDAFGEIPARVAWCLGRHAGGSFEDEISVNRLLAARVAAHLEQMAVGQDD